MSEFDQLRDKRDRLDDALGGKVAELEHVQEQIATKRGAKKGHAPEDARFEELNQQIAVLLRERKALKARIATLEPKLERVARRVRRAARRARNRVKPKVIDLAFDRTAVRPLARQGTIYGSVGHYTAGPLDDDGDDESIALWRSFDRAHKGQGWACLGYNIGLTRDGTIVRLRGIEWVGAHTLNYNTGRCGISVHGTTGHTWSKPQLRALRKALKKYGLGGKPVIGHHQAPGQSTACPGSFLAGYNSKGATP